MRSPEKISLIQTAVNTFHENLAIENLCKVIRSSEETIKRRQKEFEESKIVIEEELEKSENRVIQLRNDSPYIKMIAEDTRNMRVTVDVLQNALDGKLEKLKQCQRIFANVFINFDVNDFYKLVGPLSKRLFHGKLLFYGEILESNLKGKIQGFFINLFSSEQTIKWIDPTFRHSEAKERNEAIEEAALTSLHSVGHPLRLIEAVKENDLQKINFLLDIKIIDINLPGKDGNTALHWAYKANNLDLAAILICEGANQNLKNEKGKLPIEMITDPQIKVRIEPALKQ